MRRIPVLFVCLFLLAQIPAQIIVIGHTQLNNNPLTDVKVNVMNGKTIEQTQSLGKKTAFNLTLPFGKKYNIVVQHPDCPVMFVEIDGTKVPADKQNIRMVHELDLPFYYKNDEDVDTTVFVKPCQLVFFDGNTKMVTDTAYITKFYKKVIKAQKPTKTDPQNVNIEVPATIAARVLLNDYKIAVKNQVVNIYDVKGNKMRSTKTDRFGNFVVSNIVPSQMAKIEVVAPNGNITNASNMVLYNASQNHVIKTTYTNSKAEWALEPIDKVKLVDNSYTSNIGGKLVHVKKGKKEFMANKNVYLCNKRNTVLKKTKTNSFGAFAFDEIKPDQNYLIGVEANEVEKGDRIDLISKDDDLVSKLDTSAGGRVATRITSSSNDKYNALSVNENELRMNVNAKLYGDNVSNPLGKVKVLLLNDAYEVIDSTTSDDLGAFKFKYLPYLKRFYLSAENNNNQFDIFGSILMFSNEDNLVKIMTHVKGQKFVYKTLNTEINNIRDLELEDPWLELGSVKKQTRSIEPKVIIEPILFDNNKYELLEPGMETLNKILVALKNNTAIKAEISAHTDSKGNDTDNLKLSEQRAKAVVDYLVSNGIAANRLTSKGYGESKIINRCKNGVDCGELEHATNRRVEFKILSK
jgi:outer membrane protein OmpA-like peptidoglycan-associated protein